MKTDDHLFVNGQKCTSFVLWQGSGSDVVAIERNTNDICLHLHNIWDKGVVKKSQASSSRMLVEKTHNGFRYSCNNIGIKTKFDKLVFKIDRIRRSTFYGTRF